MSKKLLRKFDIKIQSLSNNEHKFRFEFNQELFDFFSQENEIINTNGICEVSLIKSDLMLDVKFSINGLLLYSRKDLPELFEDLHISF